MSMALLRSRLRTARSAEVLGICAHQVAAWCSKRSGGFVFCSDDWSDFEDAEDIAAIDRGPIVECLVTALYKGKFEKEDHERAVVTALADKAKEDWEEECWRHGAMIALLQRAVRCVFLHDDAQTIFDDDADDHDSFGLRERLHCALGMMWRRCLATSPDDAEQRRAMSKVRSSLNGYFKAMNFAKAERLSLIQKLGLRDHEVSDTKGWTSDAVDIVDTIQPFLPEYLDSLDRASEQFRVAREVLNWALCPTDVAVTGLHHLLNRDAVDLSGKPQRSFKFLLDRPDWLDALTKLRWLQSAMRAPDDTQASTVQLMVHREAPLKELCEQLITRQRLTAGISIRFDGETGQDEGGLWREYLPIALSHLLDEGKGLFIERMELRADGEMRVTEPRWNAASLVQSDKERNDLYELFGVLFGLALLYHAPSGVHLSVPFMHAVLGRRCDVADMREVRERLAKMEEMKVAGELDGLCQTFSVDEANTGETLDLKQDGRNIDVCSSNFGEYCELYTNFEAQGRFAHMLPAFRRGLSRLMSVELFSMFCVTFAPAELDVIFSGDVICTDDWRQHTAYEGFTADAPLVHWFWDIVSSLSNIERQDLWEFCSGSKGLPPGGFARLTNLGGEVVRFTLRADGGPPERLPVSHTCFYQLDIPSAYASPHELRAKLLAALAYGRNGFGLA